MKVSVIPADKAIIVNGEALTFDFQYFPPNLHAIQWDGVSGAMEFTQGPQVFIDNVSLVQPYIDAWNAEKARLEAEAAAAAGEGGAGTVEPV